MSGRSGWGVSPPSPRWQPTDLSQDLWRGPRTSRHIYSGLRFEIESERDATGTSVCLSFAADGLPPLPAKPFLVGDFVDRYRRGDDGRWRIAERRIQRVFTSD